MFINKDSSLDSRSDVWGRVISQKVTDSPTLLYLQNKKHIKSVSKNLWSVKYECPGRSPPLGHTKLKA